MKRTKFFGWTLSWLEILLLLVLAGLSIWSNYHTKDKEEPTIAPVDQVAAVLGYPSDESHINVEVWLMKYRLEFDKADADYAAMRETNMLRKRYMEQCFLATAQLDKYNRLSDEQVHVCLKEADAKTEEALAYWRKK